MTVKGCWGTRKAINGSERGQGSKGGQADLQHGSARGPNDDLPLADLETGCRVVSSLRREPRVSRSVDATGAGTVRVPAHGCCTHTCEPK